MKSRSVISKAASALGKRSAKLRRKAWGEEEFHRRMHEYGKLGGRPKGSTKVRPVKL